MDGKVKYTGEYAINVTGVGDFAPGEEKSGLSPEKIALIRGINSPLFVISGDKAKGKEK